MDFIRSLFSRPPIPPDRRQEVDRLLEELLRIGQTDDYLAERPTMGFNMQYRHVRTREIGKRLHEIGGLALMEYAHGVVKRKLGKNLSAHLEYAWAEVGDWKP